MPTKKASKPVFTAPKDAFTVDAILKELQTSARYTKSRKTFMANLDDLADKGYLLKISGGRGRTNYYRLAESAATMFDLDLDTRNKAYLAYQERVKILKNTPGVEFHGAANEPSSEPPLPDEPTTRPGEEDIKTNLMVLICQDFSIKDLGDTGIYARYIDSYPDPGSDEFYRVLDIMKNERAWK